MPKGPYFRKEQTLAEVVGSLRRPKTLSETGWNKVSATNPQGISFNGSWNNVSPTDAHTSWYMNELGEVKMRGKLNGGVAGDVIFTLPEEVRPETTHTFICSFDDNGNLSLDGIKFRAFQSGDLD